MAMECLRQENQIDTCGVARYNMTATRQKTSETTWKEKTDISKISSDLHIGRMTLVHLQHTHAQAHAGIYYLELDRDNTWNLRYHTFL